MLSCEPDMVTQAFTVASYPAIAMQMGCTKCDDQAQRFLWLKVEVALGRLCFFFGPRVCNKVLSVFTHL